MKFVPTPLDGAYLIKPDTHTDDRGGFFRAWCHQEFVAAQLSDDFVQWSVSTNPRRRTLRGMHFQAAPHEEIKLVACGRGRIFDVIIDLRPRSPTRHRWFGAELTAERGDMMYVPRGVAHGFLTLDDDSTVHYHIAGYYEAEAARGVRWNDPRFGIDWPSPPDVISDRDASYADVEG